MEKVWQYSLSEGWLEIPGPASGDENLAESLRAAGYIPVFGQREMYALHVVVWEQAQPEVLPRYLVYLDDDNMIEGMVYCKDMPSLIEILGKYSSIAANFATVEKRADDIDKAADHERRGR